MPRMRCVAIAIVRDASVGWEGKGSTGEGCRGRGRAVDRSSCVGVGGVWGDLCVGRLTRACS